MGESTYHGLFLACSTFVHLCNAPEVADKHRKPFKQYHQKYIGFEAALKSLRARNADAVESTAQIPLPLAVQTQITSKSNLAWRDSSTRIIYVDLKAFVEEYAVEADRDEFEIT